MFKWMKDVWQEVKKIQDVDVESLNKTMSEAESDDKIVGEIPLDLRKLRVFIGQCRKQSAESVTAAKFATEKEEIAQNEEAALAFKKKSNLLSEIFWTSIRDMFNLWGEESSSLVIKRGWKVVVCTEDDYECSCCPICTMMGAVIRMRAVIRE